eukprot:63742-Chlamydomonas_euryale.AAC.2
MERGGVPVEEGARAWDGGGFAAGDPKCCGSSLPTTAAQPSHIHTSSKCTLPPHNFEAVWHARRGGEHGTCRRGSMREHEGVRGSERE